MKSYIITSITFLLFTVEALIHYNIGKNSKNSKFQIHIPTIKDFIQLSGTVFLFSVLNGVIIEYFF